MQGQGCAGAVIGMATNILCFGDSIAWGAMDDRGGWVGRLWNHFVVKNERGDFDFFVYNLSIPGEDTNSLIERAEQEIKSRTGGREENIIIYAIGMNDSVVKSDKKSVVPLDQFKKNLEILWLIGKRNSKKVIFVGLNPIVEKMTSPLKWDPQKSVLYNQVGSYNDAVRQFCEESKLGFVDVFDDWMGEDHSKLLDDGLHPNGKGHERIFQRVREVLERKGLI